MSCQRKSVLVNNSAAVEIKPSPTFLSWALRRKSATRADTQNLDRRSASLSGESRPRYQSAPTTTCLNSGTDLCQADRNKPALLPVRKPTTIKHTEQPGEKNKSINEIELLLLFKSMVVLQSPLCNLTVKKIRSLRNIVFMWKNFCLGY